MNVESSRPMIFGEVLFDRFADGSIVLGGAPFNVAWHLQAFGLSPLFISKVGDDPLGRQVRAAMLSWGMDTSGLGLDSAHPTGIVEVSIDNGEPEYDICPNRAYDFIYFDDLPPLSTGGALYHGTLALRSNDSLQALEYIKQTYSPAVFVDVNLRPPWWSMEHVLALLPGARWLKLNEHELASLVPEAKDRSSQVQLLHAQYGFEYLFLTLGEAGACVYAADKKVIEVKPGKQNKVVDTVGAGDAFSSVVMLGLLKGWPLETMIQRAQSFASRLVQLQGATIADPEFYHPLIESWDLA